MTSVAVASSEGWVRVLRALMTAGVPLEKIQTPDQVRNADRPSAGAAMHWRGVPCSNSLGTGESGGRP